jgi:hypothetical protein
MIIENKVLKYFNENATKGLSMEAQIEAWIEQADKSVLEKSKASYPTCELNHMRLTFNKGRKYYKVVITSNNGQGQASVYCFIDKEGNIYKPATWKAPAKGIRGHINEVPANEVHYSTSWLYRR